MLTYVSHFRKGWK